MGPTLSLEPVAGKNKLLVKLSFAPWESLEHIHGEWCPRGSHEILHPQIVIFEGRNINLV